MPGLKVSQLLPRFLPFPYNKNQEEKTVDGLYNFDAVIDRRGTNSEKWDRFEPTVLPLWVADMDFPTAEPIVEALQERIRHRILGYTNEISGLREAILAWLEVRHQWKVQAEDIVLLPGVVTGFNLAARVFCKEGQDGGGPGSVLVQPPVYPPFLSVGENAGVPLLENPLISPLTGTLQYQIDFEGFETALKHRPGMFLLCNPHNPVGRVFTRKELERMAEGCLRSGTLICSDEIHADLIFSGHKHIPIASLDREIAERTITLMSPSKTFNIPSLEFAFAVIPNPEIRKTFQQARKGCIGEVNLFGMIAARAAYRQSAYWLDAVLRYLEENRNYLVKAVKEKFPGIRMTVPEGTYLAWLDCTLAGFGAQPGRFFLDQARVGLNEGETFGTGGAGHVRLNFACPRSLLEEAVHRIEQVFVSASSPSC
jgi:cystathionine beta-lyase